jgi:hypothetical protein
MGDAALRVATRRWGWKESNLLVQATVRTPERESRTNDEDPHAYASSFVGRVLTPVPASDGTQRDAPVRDHEHANVRAAPFR